MKNRVLVAGGALLALAFSSGTGRTQCAFEHPAKAKKFQASLVQAFIGCATYHGASCCNEANTTTEAGMPACKPPETFNEVDGSPVHGWLWGPASKGTVSIKPVTADLAVSLKLTNIETVSGPATGTGSLSVIVRATLNDPLGGDMTAVDFSVAFPVSLTNGSASVKSTFNAVFAGPPYNFSLPPCASIEIVSVSVSDEEGAAFARVGVWLQ
jgi:hypothetical protein